MLYCNPQNYDTNDHIIIFISHLPTGVNVHCMYDGMENVVFQSLNSKIKLNSRTMFRKSLLKRKYDFVAYHMLLISPVVYT
jgi:hypothetical protein